MAKKFVFDDEEQLEIFDIEEREYQGTNENKQVDEPTIIVEKKDSPIHIEDYQVNEDFTNEEESSEKQSLIKRVLHMKWRWWHYVLFALLVLVLIFAGYIYAVTNNDGPVYGNRCEGVVAIPVDAKTSTIEQMKKEHKDIVELEIEIVCKQIKFDIVFKEGTKTKNAIKIAEQVIKAFDSEVGISKDENKTFSNLFGSIDNEPQYEINVCLECDGNKDFPIYGTKHVQRDKITYTYAKITDQDSYDKAVSTLEEK